MGDNIAETLTYIKDEKVFRASLMLINLTQSGVVPTTDPDWLKFDVGTRMEANKIVSQFSFLGPADFPLP